MIDHRFPFDEALLRALNGLGWESLDALWVAASSKLFGVGIAIVVALGVLATHKVKGLRPVVQGTLACVVADSVGHQLIKPYFNRMRPHFAMPKELVRHWAEAAATGPSLPSLHAATSFAFAIGLGLALPSTLRITLPVALLISVSRIGVGVHWPSDVLAGAVYGSVVGWLTHLLFQRVWPKRVALAG